MSAKHEVREIRASLRPHRIAVLINSSDADWQNTCLRIMECTTAIWGGWYSCIIPSDGQTIAEPFWQVLRRFDPDYIFRYQKTGRDIEIGDSTRFSDWVLGHCTEFQRKHGELDSSGRETIADQLRTSPTERFEISSDLQKELSERLNPFMQLGTREVHAITARMDQPPWPLTGLREPLRCFAQPNVPLPLRIEDIDFAGTERSLTTQLLLHSARGKLWTDMRISLKGHHCDIGHSGKQPEDPGALIEEQAKNGPFVPRSPTQLSLLGCDLSWPIGGHPSQSLPAFVVGGELEDFCFYHCLCRLRPNVYWVPLEWLDAYASVSHGPSKNWSWPQGEATFLGTALRALWFGLGGSRALFTTILLSDEAIDDARHLLADRAALNAGVTEQPLTSSTRDLGTVVPWIWRLYERDSVNVRRWREQFLDGMGLSYIDSPRPKQFADVQPHSFQWVVEVSVERYQLPPRPTFGPATIEHPNYDSNFVRVSSDGFAYLCPNFSSGWGDLDRTIVRPALRLLTDAQVVTRIFDGAGLHTRPSDKGDYHVKCRELFGGFERLVFQLRRPYVRAVLDACADPKNVELPGARLAGRRFLSLSDVQALHDKTDTLVPVAAVEVIAELLDLRVLQRGLALHCSYCRHGDWYSVDDIGHAFVCRRCRTRQTYSKEHWREGAEPVWHYALAEVVYQAWDNDLLVPILALDALRRRDPASFIYMPELEVRSDALSTKPDTEVDFCCVLSGQVLVGEAKRTAKIDAKQCGRLAHVATAIRADEVVLATMDTEWPETLRSAFEQLSSGRPVTWLARADLLDPSASVEAGAKEPPPSA